MPLWPLLNWQEKLVVGKGRCWRFWCGCRAPRSLEVVSQARARSQQSTLGRLWLANREEFEQLTRTIESKLFWARARIIHELGFQTDGVGRRCEGWQCHNTRVIWHASGSEARRQLPKPPSCDFQACRAPELACGAAAFAFK